MQNIQTVIDSIYDEMKKTISVRGRSRIIFPNSPRLIRKQFGIAVTTVEGETFVAGDAIVLLDPEYLQSLHADSCARQGGESVWKRVGREPSGSSFNSIVQLEHETRHSRNPFVNAGAIVVTEWYLLDTISREKLLVNSCGSFAISPMTIRFSIDNTVAKSEQATGFRNFALANFMRSFGNIHPVDHTLGVYFHQCALSMNACSWRGQGSSWPIADAIH